MTTDAKNGAWRSTGAPERLRVELLNTGSELLLGDVLNTHLTGLAQRLFPLGLLIERQVAVPDGAPIRGALIAALDRCDILLVTGGLGPTTDDVTREITAELLGLPLTEDAGVLDGIRQRVLQRRHSFPERLRRQAMVPATARVLANPYGTAPGLYLAPQGSAWHPLPHIFLLPGPPRELFPMVDADVLPILQKLTDGRALREKRIYHVVGMGESMVEQAVGLSLTQRGDIEVGYCARPNEVDFRLIAPTKILDEVEPQVLAALGSCLVSKAGERIESWVVHELIRRQMVISTAESCTGGLLAHRLTNVPGASAVFSEGFITYSNAAKMRALGVSGDLLSAHGSVSAPVASAMASGALERTGADIALSLTGLAGPEGGTENKPVGTVFIGLARKGRAPTAIQENCFSDRETFKQLATQKALDLVRLDLLDASTRDQKVD